MDILGRVRTKGFVMSPILPGLSLHLTSRIQSMCIHCLVDVLDTSCACLQNPLIPTSISSHCCRDWFYLGCDPLRAGIIRRPSFQFLLGVPTLKLLCA